MKLRPSYDVVVVGGGPGGAAAALVAARGGLDVLLVEKRQEIGSPVRCAEAIGYELIKPYIDIDYRWVAAEIDAFRIVGPAGHSVRVPPTSPTMVVERKLFDRELVNEAVRAGASVRAKTRVTDVLREDGFIRGVKLVSMGQEPDVRAKIVIAADGAESQVGRWAGLKTIPRLREYYSGVQYLLAGIELADPRECQYHLGTETAPGGYAWVFPKGSDKANVGLVITPPLEQNGHSAQDYLDKFVERHFPDASILSLVLGGIPVDGTMKRFVDSGIMLVGDAAHQAEPVTGGGINLAIDAGALAGQVAVEAIEDGDWSRKRLQTYEKRWNKENGRSHKAMSNLRHAAIKFNDERVDSLLELAASLPLEQMSAFDIILRVLRHDPKLLLFARNFILP